MKGSEFAQLSAFAAIADCGSFVRAAAQLGVSPSALSQTIRSLEERLGVRVLNRTTRSVALTDAGASLLARIAPALQELDAAAETVNAFRDRPAGTLRINTSRMAADMLIAPLLGRFLVDYPDIVLEVGVNDALTDVVAEGFDAGIRLGERLQQDMLAVRLGGPLRQVAVASPDYVAKHGRPRTPRDLHAHRCINWRENASRRLYRWEFEQGDEVLEVAVNGPLIVNDVDLAIRAAIDGVGITYPMAHQSAPFVRSDQLVTLLEDWSPPFPGLFLYYPSRRQVPTTLRVFIEYLQTELASSTSVLSTNPPA